MPDTPTTPAASTSEAASPVAATTVLTFGLPKGRMFGGVSQLLNEAGLGLRPSDRNYRPRLTLPYLSAKLLKPQNIVEMLQLGSRDVGFAGADWVAEKQAELVELLDTGLDPVRIVAAAPAQNLTDGKLVKRPLRVASEYQRLTRAWIEQQGLNATFVRSYGATEVFPPEDADCIVDNTATGSTLRDNALVIVDELMRSTTRLYANPRAMDDAHKRPLIDDLVQLVRSVMHARERAMVEVNVNAAQLQAIVDALPCMRKPTISPLVGEQAFAVKAAVPRAQLPALIGALKARGGTDIVVSNIAQVVA